MKRTAIRVFLLCLVLSLCLPFAGASAAGEGPKADAGEAGPAPEAEQVPEEREESGPEADAGEAEPAPEAEQVPEIQEESGPAAVRVGPGDTYFAQEGSLVYNDTGVVYNNGGTVYNNGGTVYSNGGTVYNNAGLVYANGGTVYNNAGTVYSNGAEVVFPEERGAALAPDVGRVRLSEGFDAFADVEGLTPEQGTGAYLLKEGADCVIRPRAGYLLFSPEVTGGELAQREDGAWLLTLTEREAALTLRFQPEAPRFSLTPGTYGEAQTVEISAPEGARVYYTVDGSQPGADSALYQAPIAVEEGLTLRAVAVAEGAEPSAVTEAAYALVKVSAPEFEPAEAGYGRVAPQPVTVENGGAADARIKEIRLSGDGAGSFVLAGGTDRSIPAGSTDTRSWTVQPKSGLKAGTYTAALTVVFDGGGEQELTVSFTVTEPTSEPASEGETGTRADTGAGAA